MILTPRFDAADFERVKKERLVAIETRGDNLGAVAGSVFRRLLYGAGRVQGAPAMGTKATVAALTIDDVAEHWKRNVLPRGGRLVYLGARDAKGVEQLLAPLTKAWRAPAAVEASARVEPEPPQVFATRIYLVDKPGAAQSEPSQGPAPMCAWPPKRFPAMPAWKVGRWLVDH